MSFKLYKALSIPPLDQIPRLNPTFNLQVTSPSNLPSHNKGASKNMRLESMHLKNEITIAQYMTAESPFRGEVNQTLLFRKLVFYKF
jgi:hypothetical protein